MPDEATQVQAPAQEQSLQEELTPESLTPETVGAVEVDIAPKSDEDEPLTAEQLKFMPKEHQDAYNEKKTKYQTRIDELTKKFRDSERKTIELETKLRMAEERPSQQIQQIQQQPQQQLNPEQIIFQMKQQKREALANMNFVVADEIQDQISTYQEQLKEHKQRISTTQAQIQGEIKNTLNKFQTETEWFNKASTSFSEPMAGYAAYLEYQLASTWRGSYSELLSNIKEKVEQEFSYQKGKEKKPISFIGGANTQQTSAPKTIRLSQEQRDVAMKMFGDSPDALKKYAQELYKIEGSGRAQSAGR